MSIDETTEEKIKSSARIIFMKKGFSATKIRDIADHADINLALVNYYFRSKEKLFQEIMMESMQGFFHSIITIFFEEESSIEDKLNRLAKSYIDMLIQQPDMPLFILSELQSNPERFVKTIVSQTRLRESVLFRQLKEQLGEEKIYEIDPVHMFMNLMGLIVFPFIAKPMLLYTAEIELEIFNQLMEERKKLIPLWIMNLMK